MGYVVHRYVKLPEGILMNIPRLKQTTLIWGMHWETLPSFGHVFSSLFSDPHGYHSHVLYTASLPDLVI
jgi:hypothetical protein